VKTFVNIKKLILIILVCTFFPDSVLATDFLRAQVPARPAALGGAFGAHSDDPHAFLWNPAALASVKQPGVGATHFSSIIDTDFDQVVFVQPLPLLNASAGLGFMIQYSTTKDFYLVDLEGNQQGLIDNFDLLILGGYGITLTGNFGLGLNLKVFNRRLDEFRSRGFALDLGVRNQINSFVEMGISVLELGVQEAFDQQSDVLPSAVRLSLLSEIYKNFENSATVSMQLDRPWNMAQETILSCGLEYSYRELIAFRVGYRLGSATGNLTMGLGFHWQGINLDYTYISLGDLGISQRFGVSVWLGKIFEKANWMLPLVGEKDLLLKESSEFENIIRKIKILPDNK
jgi:hypothetical protein